MALAFSNVNLSQALNQPRQLTVSMCYIFVLQDHITFVTSQNIDYKCARWDRNSLNDYQIL